MADFTKGQKKNQISHTEAMLNTSGKLLGLVDLLKQCEIIENENDGDDMDGEPKPKARGRKPKDQAAAEQFEGLIGLQDDESIGQKEQMQESAHRALIFC